ncbi:uncharacterized protein PgNI_12343 [Pyricularia grisea]|uniref:Uncharacterized protein n=1 Tax=Pyricularia grisea TaxID=148305 RepID=A0A6P8AN15_PYRGI|nr:uncharacterized protein PgNI_12343 [Pyricularia grisea]TLD03415.1 hypothetical protein PgNI_12343 [Pyricularia grisea]
MRTLAELLRLKALKVVVTCNRLSTKRRDSVGGKRRGLVEDLKSAPANSRH